MSASPAQGYNVPVKVEIGTSIDTKVAPETVIGEKTGFVAKDTELFATDLTPTGLVAGEQHGFTITVCVKDIEDFSGGDEEEAHLEMTFDSGANWCRVEHVEDDDLKIFPEERATGIPVKFGDQVNFRFDEDLTIILFRIGERQC